MENQTIKGKRKARKLALQALYQWAMTQNETSQIEAQYYAMNDMSKVDAEYFKGLFKGVLENLAQLEQTFSAYMDRALDSLTPIELSVLRLSTYELMFCPEIPYRVVLNEAVTLSKTFGSQDGYRFVNGVLNQLAHKIRATEISQKNE